jgi:hypothetical protein
MPQRMDFAFCCSIRYTFYKLIEKGLSMKFLHVRDIANDVWHFLLTKRQLYIFIIFALCASIVLSVSQQYLLHFDFYYIATILSGLFTSFWAFSFVSFVLQDMRGDYARIGKACWVGLSKVIEYCGVVAWFIVLHIAFIPLFEHPSIYNNTFDLLLLCLCFGIQATQTIMNFFLVPMLVDRQYTILYLFQKSWRYITQHHWVVLKLCMIYVGVFMLAFYSNAFIFSLVRLFLSYFVQTDLAVFLQNLVMQMTYFLVYGFVLITQVSLYHHASE